VGQAHADPLESGTSVPTTSESERITKSQELMRLGATKFAQGDWQGAYLSYQKAWELKPHPAVAANMAASEIRLGMYLSAAAHLKYALNNLPPVQLDKRDAVERQLDRVREHLVAVSLSADLDGVEIAIDGKPAGRTPLAEEVLLEPGHHSIRAEYAGVAQTKAVDLAAGAHVDLLFDLRGTESPAQPVASIASPAQPFARERKSMPNQTRTWVLVGGAASAVISLGVGIAMRIQASEEAKDAQTLRVRINSAVSSSDRVTGETCESRYQSDACDLLYRNVRAVNRDRDISTGAFVAAGVLGVATVATALLWPSAATAASSSSSVLGRVEVAGWAPSKGFGLSASLDF
jgi:hypothetical protein